MDSARDEISSRWGEPAKATGGTAALRSEQERLEHNARRLLDVLALAEALPTRHDPELRYPRLVPRPPG